MAVPDVLPVRNSAAREFRKWRRLKGSLYGIRSKSTTAVLCSCRHYIPFLPERVKIYYYRACENPPSSPNKKYRREQHASIRNLGCIHRSPFRRQSAGGHFRRRRSVRRRNASNHARIQLFGERVSLDAGERGLRRPAAHIYA